MLQMQKRTADTWIPTMNCAQMNMRTATHEPVNGNKYEHLTASPLSRGGCGISCFLQWNIHGWWWEEKEILDTQVTPLSTDAVVAGLCSRPVASRNGSVIRVAVE
jgi:hypothetical protein